MFEYDPSTHRLVDPSDGEELRTTDSHWQSDSVTVGIFSPDGVRRFSATFRSYSIDEPHTWPTGKLTRKILLHAVEYGPDGRAETVLGPHPQIRRLVAFYRNEAMSKSDGAAFEFVDERSTDLQ